MRDSAVIHLKEMQVSHEKGGTTYHENQLQPQKYLVTSKLSNKRKSLLFNSRCQSVKGVRQNFSKMYVGDVQSRLCNLDIDCQNHNLTCQALKNTSVGTMTLNMNSYMEL